MWGNGGPRQALETTTPTPWTGRGSPETPWGRWATQGSHHPGQALLAGCGSRPFQEAADADKETPHPDMPKRLPSSHDVPRPWGRASGWVAPHCPQGYMVPQVSRLHGLGRRLWCFCPILSSFVSLPFTIEEVRSGVHSWGAGSTPPGLDGSPGLPGAGLLQRGLFGHSHVVHRPGVRP